MFSWFTVLIIILVLPAVFTVASNNTSNSSSDENHEHLSLQDRIEKGMSVRKHVKTWQTEVLKYNVSQIHSLQAIYVQLKILAECPYGHVKLQNLTIKKVRARLVAITEKGNYIPYLNISVGSYVQKPAIVVIGGIKGCHWLTVAAAMNLAQDLVVNYNKNHEHTSRVTWIIIPVLNPDGYHVTLSDKNMINWPKNMAKPLKLKPDQRKQKRCFGVDLSLNFEFQWIEFLDTKNASWCDDDYADKPFTQNETKAVRDTVADHLDSVKIFVSLEQNKRLLMYPFRYTHIRPIFWRVYQRVLQHAAKAAYKKHSRSFDYGHVLKFQNKAAGELDDWVMAHLGVNLGFTFDIAIWMNNNETPSGKEIQWTSDETFAALKVIARLGARFDEMGFLPSGIDTNDCRKTYAVNTFVFVAITLLQMIVLLK